MEATRSEYPAHHPRVTSRTFEGETVIVDPEKNVIRMLNEVGSRIWELADGTRTPGEIATILTGEFDVSLAVAEQAVLQFVEELVQKELLAPH